MKVVLFVLVSALVSTTTTTYAQDVAQTAVAGQVIGLNLIKAGQSPGTVVSTLYNDTVITIPFGAPIPKFSIVALIKNGTTTPIRSVQFDFNGVTNFRTETTGPFALCGNQGDYYNACRGLGLGNHTVTAKTSPNGTAYTVSFVITQPATDPYEALQLNKRNVVQLGPRPYFLVKDMKPSPLKTKLTKCAKEIKLFQLSDFAIGHRGSCLQFPEHTASSYEAAILMGAGVAECDVTFTKDLQLVCRHAQCDLHTTTDVVTRPDLNAKCTTPFAPGVRPKCCTTDFTLAEIKTLCAKMDSSNIVNTTDPKRYAFGGTADFRTDLYQTGCPAVITHKESVEIILKSGGKFTPELKAPEVPMPFNGFTQDNFVAKMVQDYIDLAIPPEHVWVQSNTVSDLAYLVNKTAYGKQAVALDFDDNRNTTVADLAWIDMLKKMGVQILAPPMWKLVAPNPLAGQPGQKDIVPSTFAKQIKAAGLGIITWTLSRTAGPLEKPVAVDYYWQTLQAKGLNLTEGSNFDLLDALYEDVGIIAIFDDWPSVSAFYANCIGIKLRLF